jgi:DNA-binding CsgD family transcriptional regulator
MTGRGQWFVSLVAIATGCSLDFSPMLVGQGLLLERDTELARLRAVLGAARERAGSLVVVTGPAGIGKTRLARAAGVEAEEAGFRVLVARGAELERDYAFGVVRQWFEPLLRDGDDAVGLGRAAELAGPALRGDPVRGPDRSFSVLHGLYWLAADLSESGPVALVLDDAQWSDEASLRLVDFLARRLDGLAELVVLAAREPLTGIVAELAADAATEVLELRPLGLDAVAAFLRERTDGTVDDAFARACLDATGGNPFLLTELTQALLDEGIEFVTAERGRVPTLGPRAVATAIQRRLGQLPEAATRLARAAAVAGDVAPLWLVAALAGLEEPEADSAADELAQAQVLEDRRPLRFVHPIVAAAVSESLLAGEREALHARAAALLVESGAPAEAVAAHLLHLAPRGDEQAAAVLAEAAMRAKSRGASEEAMTLLVRALEEPPAPTARPRLLLELGEAETALDRPGAEEHLREAHRLARDPAERARTALLLTWAVVSRTGERGDVADLLERSIEELPVEDRDLALRLEAAWMSVAWDRGQLDAVLARGERFAAFEGRTPGECLVLAYLAHARMDDGRSADEVAPLAERAANPAFVRELGLSSTWLIHTGTVLRSAEQFDAELLLLDQAIADAQRAGSLRAYALASMYRSAVLNRAGDVGGAEADARAALVEGAREVVVLPAVAQLVEALVEQCRLDEASLLLERHGLTDAMPEYRHGTVVLFSRALLRAERGDPAGALADLAETRKRLDRVGRLNIVGLDGRVRTALLRAALGDRAIAEEEALVAVDVSRRWGTPGALGTALRALALVRRDLGRLEEAVALLTRSPLRLEHARALVDLGAMLRRGGRRSESRGPLREGLAIADECGGIAVRERAREELAASGVRVRREALRGVAALTPSERRIVDRAAAGASNPEIAQALFVTVKTVEMHLSNAYRKLGISGRGELARALNEDD